MKRVVLALVVLAAAGVALYVWRSRGSGDTPATPAVTQGSGSATATPSTSRAAAPARATITVMGAKGPLAGAVVRLAPEEGDVVVLTTGADGRVHATALAPGRYDLSASASGHEPGAVPAREIAAGEDLAITITLAPGGRTLTGTVTDVKGGFIAGARVDAARIGGRGRPEDAVATVLTGADGTYALTTVEGHLLVAVSSADYAAQSRYVEVGATGAVADFALVPGGAIEGIVRDERTRDPVPGAVVTAARDRGGVMMLAEPALARAVAGADGRFRLNGLRPGVYELGARAAMRTTKAPAVVGLGVAEQVPDVEILISDGPVISGVVVDEGGAPVANVEVNAFAQGRGRGGDARSGADGAFTLAGLAPGGYALMASGGDHLAHGMTPVELADKDVADVRVRVRRGIQITGHVEPRQICEVSHDIADEELGPGLPTLIAPRTTAVDGEFSLGPATAGKARLRARCPGGDQGEAAITVAAGMAPVVLKVSPGASIAGRVVDGAREAVAGVTVMADLQGPTARTMIVNGMVTSGVQGVTGASGTFELVGLTPGTYALRVLDRGRPLRMRGKPVEVALGATEKKTGVELAVDRPDGKIEGVVTGPDGRPLEDAWVSVHQNLSSMVDDMVGRGRGEPDGEDGEDVDDRMMIVAETDDGGGAGAFPPALTDAQGRFSITGLPHAKYEVIAEAQAGALRGRTPDVTPDATITIKTLGVTTLSGTVRTATGPARVFTVELEGPTRAVRTFTDGKFQLGRVDPGAYTVRVTSPEGNAETTVQVVPKQPTQVALVLAANAIVVGTIVDAADKPLEGVGVTLIPDQGDGRAEISIEGPPLTSGPDGKFRLETKAGPSILVVLTRPRPVTKPGLALEAGKTLDVGAIRIEGEPPPSP